MASRYLFIQTVVEFSAQVVARTKELADLILLMALLESFNNVLAQWMQMQREGRVHKEGEIVHGDNPIHLLLTCTAIKFVMLGRARTSIWQPKISITIAENPFLKTLNSRNIVFDRVATH